MDESSRHANNGDRRERSSHRGEHVSDSASHSSQSPHAAHETPDPPVIPPENGGGEKRRAPSPLRRLLRPRLSRSQLLAALLCAVVGFAGVVQVNQTQSDGLASLRQADLVRLLDEVSQRTESLEDERDELNRQLDLLRESSSAAQAAQQANRETQLAQGVLSGRLAAHGPGLVVTVSGPVTAAAMVNVLQELRNAGAEAVSINDVRIVVSTSFTESTTGLVVDGNELSEPYIWRVIGDPATLQPALEIPGGALATLRNLGADVQVSQRDDVEITARRTPRDPSYATESDEQD